jgi:hypothetical protein
VRYMEFVVFGTAYIRELLSGGRRQNSPLLFLSYFSTVRHTQGGPVENTRDFAKALCL